MKRQLLLSFALVCSGLLLNASTTLAERPAGCNLIGSWYGYSDNYLAWVSTASGQSASSGTYVLEFPGFVDTLAGAVRMSAARGTWERLDGSTFAGTALALAVDSNGLALHVIKVSAVNALSADCNTMFITNSIEFFYGYQDPFEDDPYYVIPPYTHTGFRMHTDPLATP